MLEPIFLGLHNCIFSVDEKEEADMLQKIAKGIAENEIYIYNQSRIKGGGNCCHGSNRQSKCCVSCIHVQKQCNERKPLSPLYEASN